MGDEVLKRIPVFAHVTRTYDPDFRVVTKSVMRDVVDSGDGDVMEDVVAYVNLNPA